MYQFIHEGIRNRCTASVDTLYKWTESHKTDPNIAIILVDACLYIAGERNDLPQFPNLTVHSDTLRIGCPSIIVGFIPASLAYTQQNYFTQIGSKKRDSNGPANS